jgi:protein TonB
VLSFEPSRNALLAAAPIMVELISPPKAEPTPPRPPKPEPQSVVQPRPRPEPVPVRPPDPTPLATAPVQAPTPVEVAPPPPPPPAPAPVAVAAPQPVVETPPIFTADYLDNPKPVYPARSRRLGEQGRVVLRVLVNAGGTADQVQVRASSGFLRLDDAALDTVRRWRFVPAKRGSQAVPAWVLIPVSFSLEG